MDEIRSTLLYRDGKFKTARWITDREAAYLCKLIKMYNIIEVYESGTANGYSACRMAELGKVRVTTFDPYLRPHIWDEPEFTDYKKRITFVQAKFETLDLESSNVPRLFFIDGDHDGVPTTNDLNAALRAFKPGDVIALHDFNEKKVVKVWQRMDKSGWDTHIEKTERQICVLTNNGERSLADIATQTGTDKKPGRHNFVAIYDPLFKDFRHEPIKFLEIGVYLCRSHDMWLEWFTNAQIYGIDICVERRLTRYDKARLHLHLVDQGDREQLSAYANEHGPWRIILDDGGHFNSQQKTSFDVLWDFVEPGGYYIVEDTHSSYWEQFMDSDQTLVERMLEITDEISRAPHYKHYYSNILRRREAEKLTQYQNEIESMTYHMGLVILKKRDDV